jgi:hypothetical protein
MMSAVLHQGMAIRSSRVLFGFLTAFIVLSPTAALPAAAAAADGPPLLAFGIGYYDVIDRDDEAVDFRLEYRSDVRLWILKPWFGGEVTTDKAIYGVAGLLVDLELSDRWILTPSAGLGLYYDGDGKDMGSTVEFRTQIEIARRFQAGSRLGFALSHISNANLDDTNPGTEILSLYYAIPLK